jgi:lysozyme
MRPIPQSAVEFVAAHEGIRTLAYKDSAGIPTIGYGHIEGVKMGDRCTKAQALAWLAADMQIAVRKLYGVLKPEVIDCLNDQQWSALLSFVFNVGAGKTWTIWKLLNDRKFDQAADQLSRFINAGGQKVPGLVNRRADEFKLFHSGDQNNSAPVPSSVTREVGMTPPTPSAEKPLAQSKTLWAGGVVAAGGVVQGAQQVQALVAPQAANNEWLQKLAGFVAVVIVLAGIAIVVFKAMEQRARTHQ